MITVPSAVFEIIKQSPFLGEALSNKIINLSGLARKIKPQVEIATMKKVELSSIIVALKRLDKSIVKHSQLNSLLHTAPDLIVRSNLIEITINNKYFSKNLDYKLAEIVSDDSKNFITITHGVFETTIISSKNNSDKIRNIFKNTKIFTWLENLTSITVHFREDIVDSPGVYYMILKVLAWNGICIVELVSTYSEITIIFKEVYVERAFGLIKKLFST